MDYAFYALVAICIFLLTLTFYLAVRRRRQTNRRQAQNQQQEAIMNSDYTQGPTIIDMSITSLPHILRQQHHHNARVSSLLFPLSSPLEHNPMTNWAQPSSLAAYKPEDLLTLPPPSYQDYPKDVRLFQ